MAIVGFLIQGVYFGLNYMAFSHGASAGAVALINSLQPLTVALLAPFFVGERMTGMRWLGLVLGLAGAALVIGSRSQIEVTSPVGILAAVGGLSGMTMATLYEKRFGVAQHPLTANCLQYLVGIAVILPLAVLTEPMHVRPTPVFFLTLAYLVIGNSIIAISLLLVMVRRGEAMRVSALFFLVPPLASLIAWAILGEGMPQLAWLGMALAALGVWAATVRPSAMVKTN
jgi:drug/metabolite transporter (DMT)-like permease